MVSNTDAAVPHRGRTVGLVAVCLAAFMLPVSLTGSSVATPGVTAEFHNSLAAGDWIVNGYDLTFAAFMLSTGSLADIFGRRRLFAIGSALFAACSLVSALSGDIVTLDISRVVAGVGAAAMLTSGSAMLANLFEGSSLARAFSVFGTAVGAGLAFGPFIAGTLQTSLGWRAVFALPAAAGAAALALSLLLPESSDPEGRSIDWVGMITFTGTLAALIAALIEGPTIGWGSPFNIAMYVVCAVGLVAFFIAEHKVKHPMFDLGLFRQPLYASLCAAIVALVFGFTPLLVYLPSYFVSVDAESTFHAGVDLLMLTLPTLVLPLITGYALRWIPVRHMVTIAVGLTAVGCAWLVVIAPGIGNWALLGPFLVIGIGIGISFGVMDGAAVASVEPSRAGMAAGMFNTMRLAGEAMAIAVVGALLASLTQLHLSSNLSPNPTLRAEAPRGLAAQVDQGQLASALTAAPAHARTALAAAARASYTGALRDVLWIMAGLCLITCLLVAVASTRKTMPAAQAESSSPAVADQESAASA